MRLSSKRQTELYTAISEQVMDVRIQLQNNPEMREQEKLDSELFYMTNRIWADVKTALNIKE